MFTVKQLSRIAGVSPRTLHYYDEIGLLKPAHIATNGYRYYDDNCVLRLQQILLCRELDLSLEQIKKMINKPGYDNIFALSAHKKALLKRIQRLEKLVNTVEDTILFIQGEKTMSKRQLFAALSPEEENKMEKEAMQMYDPQVVKDSNRKWKNYSKAEQERILAEGNQIYELIAGNMDKGAESAEVQNAVARWHHHIEYFWNPNDDQLLGLADLYNDDPRFKQNFDKFDPRLTEFMREAVAIYVQRK